MVIPSRSSELLSRETQEDSCWYEGGYCQVTRGNTVSTEDVQTAEQCSQLCQENTDCQHFTFLHHRGTPICSLLAECETFTPQCPSTQGCISGPKLCSCGAIQSFKTEEDSTKEYARWECGDLDPYTSSIPIGTVCTVSCPTWKEVTFQSVCMRGGSWTPSTPSTSPVSLGYSATTVVNTPDQEDMVCGCKEVGPFNYDPNDEIGAEMVCRGSSRNKDFKAEGGWSLSTTDHCDLWCSHVPVVSVYCEDSEWKGEPEKGFWCYQKPDNAEPEDSDDSGCLRESGIYYNGDNIAGMAAIPVYDEEQCRVQCYEEPSCNYWSYKPSENKCWLKTGKSDPLSIADFISGEKACGNPGV